MPRFFLQPTLCGLAAIFAFGSALDPCVAEQPVPPAQVKPPKTIQFQLGLPSRAELDAVPERLESVVAESSRDERTRKVIETALDKEVSIDFQVTPLHDVVQFFRQRLGINIDIDQKALDAAGVALEMPVTRKFEKIGSGAALRLILRQLDLRYVVTDEVLSITSSEAAAIHLQTRVYPVRDLLYDADGIADGAGDELIDAITSVVEPTTWDAVGGPSSVKGVENSAVLVVSCPAANHTQIADLLTSLRKVRQSQGIKANFSAKPADTKDSKPRKAFGADPNPARGGGPPVVG